MADRFLNNTGVATIRDWANGKFATQAEVDAIQDEIDDIVSEGGEPNKIDSISVNGTPVAPDTKKNVELTVPTKVSQLANDGDGTTGSTFPTTAQMETYVQTNGGKINKIKVNGVEQTIDTSDKSVNLTVPTKVSEITNDGDGTTGSKFATESYVDQNGGKIDVIKVNGTAQTITNKEVDLTVPTKVSDLTNDGDGTTGSKFATEDVVDTKISAAVSSAYKYKGSVATVENLPSSGNTAGDVWDVQSTGINYAWTGTAWDALGSYVDTSVLWTSTTGQTNTLEAMTVSEINSILEPTTP